MPTVLSFVCGLLWGIHLGLQYASFQQAIQTDGLHGAIDTLMQSSVLKPVQWLRPSPADAGAMDTSFIAIDKAPVMTWRDLGVLKTQYEFFKHDLKGGVEIECLGSKNISCGIISKKMPLCRLEKNHTCEELIYSHASSEVVLWRLDVNNTGCQCAMDTSIADVVSAIDIDTSPLKKNCLLWRLHEICDI